MTREEAIRILEEERDVYIPKWIKYVKLDFFDRRWVNALELAIKALEQESVLDKIIEIIEPLRHLSIDEMSDIEWQILQVIDKYTAESEDKECK